MQATMQSGDIHALEARLWFGWFGLIIVICGENSFWG